MKGRNRVVGVYVKFAFFFGQGEPFCISAKRRIARGESEARNPKQIQISKFKNPNPHAEGLEASSLGLEIVSDFGLRISDLREETLFRVKNGPPARWQNCHFS